MNQYYIDPRPLLLNAFFCKFKDASYSWPIAVISRTKDHFTTWQIYQDLGLVPGTSRLSKSSKKDESCVAGFRSQ